MGNALSSISSVPQLKKQSETPTYEADCSLEFGEEQKKRGQKRKREEGDESSIVHLFEAPFVNQMLFNEILSIGEKSSPIVSSSISTANAISGDTDAVRRGSDPLNILDNIEKANNEHDSELIENPSWGILPVISEDFIKGLCSHLYNAEDGTDMANLAMVSTPYNNGVHMFMKKNRPAIEKGEMWKFHEELVVSIHLFPSNLPFYGLCTLDSDRFERFGSSAVPYLKVTLNGFEDPIIEQISGLLSAHINDVEIGSTGDNLSPEDLSFFAQMLKHSTIGNLCIQKTNLDENTASSIIAIASCARELNLFSDDAPVLSNLSAFINKLDSLTLTSVFLYDGSGDSSLCLGLPRSFWEKFINKKLSTGSIEYVQAGSKNGKITKAPIDLPDRRIGWLKWKKVEAV